MAITPLEAIQAIEARIRNHARTIRNPKFVSKSRKIDFPKLVETKLNAASPEAGNNMLDRLITLLSGDWQPTSSPRLSIAGVGVVSGQGKSDSEVKPTTHLCSEGLSKEDLLVLRYYCYELLRRADPVRNNVLNQNPDAGARAILKEINKVLEEIKKALNQLNGIPTTLSENPKKAYSNFNTSYSAIFKNLRLVLIKFKRDFEFNFNHSLNADNLWK